MEKGERKLCIIIYVNYSITFEPPEVREAGAPPLPPIINSKHKCASLINMKRQWGRTTLSPEEGKVWACHKDYARNQYSSGPKKGLKCPGKKRKSECYALQNS